jgi:hypothetical protein
MSGHEPLLVAVSGVSPAEGDVAVGESNQSVVGDGDAVGVGAESGRQLGQERGRRKFGYTLSLPISNFSETVPAEPP